MGQAMYPRIIAHRCGGALAAENSLAGLAVAARIGCRGVEFDTMLSGDGVPVLMHDETVDRTTNGHGAVAGMTVAELRRLNLGGEPVPLLAEALTHCARLGLWANVELKAPAGGEARLGEVVGRYLATNWHGDGVVSSFSVAALVAAWRVAPDLSYALLVDALPADWHERARQAHAKAIHAAANRLTDDAVAAVRAAGLPLACYTVNRREDAECLLAHGVAIFTDRPDLWQSPEM